MPGPILSKQHNANDTKLDALDALHAAERNSLERTKGFDSDMTANFVIEFARARLAHVNSFLNRQLSSMRNGAQISDALNEAMKAVAFYAEGFDDPSKKKDLQNRLQFAAEMLPPDSPLKAKLEAFANDPEGYVHKGNDNLVTKGDIDSLKLDLEGMLKAVDRRSQEDQLYINQKMGEKSEICQLAAMIIQQMNQTVQQILGRS